METPANSVEMLFERVKTYLKTTIELSKLKLLETYTILMSSVIARIFVVLTYFMFVLAVSIGTALFLGELLGKSYYGFFIVAAFYFLLGIVLHIFLFKWIKKPVSKLIIKQVLQ